MFEYDGLYFELDGDDEDDEMTLTSAWYSKNLLTLTRTENAKMEMDMMVAVCRGNW